MTLFNETIQLLQEKYITADEIPEEWLNIEQKIPQQEYKLRFIGFNAKTTIGQALQDLIDVCDKVFVIYDDKGPIGALGQILDDTVMSIMPDIDWENASEELNSIGNLIIDKANDDNRWYVYDFFLVSFRDKNSVTLVKDLFQIIDTLLQEYHFISWGVNNNNPIKKAYDKIVNNKYHGESFLEDNITRYIITD